MGRTGLWKEGEDGRPTERWGGSELSHHLRSTFADFIDRLPPPPRAAFLRCHLGGVDSALSSHLALRQQLAVLAAVEPQPVLGEAAYARLLRLLHSRVLMSSASLKPQLLTALIAVVSRLSAFGMAELEDVGG